jgi:CheY-like chemotaxis protein
MRLEVQPIDPGQIITQTVESVLPLASAKGIEVITELDPAIKVLNADPARLQQIVWNLISNAMKFTPRGGRVRVSLQKPNDHYELTVADTGAGIAAEFLPHLFQRFSQADASSTRRFSGLGIGLAIVRHLVELHGGTVSAASEGEGHGSTFTVRLPARIAVQPAPSAKKPRAKDVPVTKFGPTDLSNVRVLVVDDERDSRSLAQRVLEMNGADVRVAGSAAEGFERLQDYRPHILVSDISMPNEDGYQFIRRIRALPADAGGRTVAVALTAFARPEDRRHALQAGYQDHIAKPMEPAELLNVVVNLRNRATDLEGT